MPHRVRSNCDELIVSLAEQLRSQGVCPIDDKQAKQMLAKDSSVLEEIADWVVENSKNLGVAKTLSQLSTHHEASKSAVRSAVRHLAREVQGQRVSALARA